MEWTADHPPHECPYCHRLMSNREAAEQGACNDCVREQTYPTWMEMDPVTGEVPE